MSAMKEETKTDESAVLVEADVALVVFTKPHRHAGIDYKAGDKAGVTRKKREKLKNRGVIS